MGRIKVCTTYIAKHPPQVPGGGEGGGGAKCGGIQRGINWANLVVPVVEDNSGFSSRRSRVVAEQE